MQEGRTYKVEEDGGNEKTNTTVNKTTKKNANIERMAGTQDART